MPPVATAAVALAFGLDLAVAEVPARIHPVAALGRVVARFDRPWSRPGLVGIVAAVVVPIATAGVAFLATALATGIAQVVVATVAGLVLFSTTSLRLLVTETGHVVDASETDGSAAKERLPALAGREPGPLTPGQVRSAAVESAAENLADGLVGPLLAFSLLAPLSMPLAAAGATWVKAVNTMDSMLGYWAKPVGRASARLDDAVMWLPARLAAGLLAVAAVDPRALVAARSWAAAPASPNSGWPMATIAAALSVRLEKPGAYVLNPEVGLPTVEDGRRGARLVGVAGGLAFAGAGVLAWV